MLSSIALFLSPCFASDSLIMKHSVLASLVAFETVGCEFFFHELICVQRKLMLQLGPIGDWSDDAIVSKRRCRDGNLGKVRVYDAFAAC